MVVSFGYERRAGAEALKQEGEQLGVGWREVRAELRVVEVLADPGVRCKDLKYATLSCPEPFLLCRIVLALSLPCVPIAPFVIPLLTLLFVCLLSLD